MDLALAEIAAGLPMAASFAFAGGITTVREGRRRAALNEALHELRRPLQALALVTPPSGGEKIDSSLHLAATALARLESEINGREIQEDLEPVPLRQLVEAAVARWRPRAELAGGALRLRWVGGLATLGGGGFAVAQALDNLIINAIVHGGGEVLIEVAELDGRVRLAVHDRGTGGRAWRRSSMPSLLARLSGRSRHGHGLRVVRRTAARRGGRFRLRRSEQGTEAVLELPTASGEGR
jgi:signal transduction histidine kinase